MTELVIAILGALAGGLLVWALSLRRRDGLPGEREAIERRREELREEEAAAVEEAKERIDEERKMDLVDWLRGFARRRDPGDR